MVSASKPALLVAAVGLVLASVGTATAAPSVYKQLTEGQVKQIAKKQADKQISARAKGLNVNSAKTAGSAKTATNATNAANATNATSAATALQAANAANAANAAALGGLPPSAFEARVAYLAPALGANTPMLTETKIIGPLSITVPQGQSYVVTDASVTVGSAGDYTIWVQADTASCAPGTGPGYASRSYGTSSKQDTSSQHVVFKVSPGTHTFLLCAMTTQSTNTYAPTLRLQTVAVDGTGGTSMTPTQKRTGPVDHNPLTPQVD